ncbi:acetylcholinesterase-like [Tribolium madens]|uniref:acetylcholinesterase-like n=1 Tax=Tribolium madens TaxID=41895 RepID=UPI001CF7368D|nr:acetylcholinesterase-like [Tribolium madens]XP_044253509.1 acetylcholinesterase-like [Tribolium madens]
MVWIHGGAFLMGSNTRDIFGPDYLMCEDIVLVSINYRLGILGFLCLEDPSLEVPGNAGMKDMVLALKWVQRNIKHFNGDPKNVTIFGESAGSASVNYLCLSPLCKGLFHKAIAQSGSPLNYWACGSRNAKVVAQMLKFKNSDEEKLLKYLRQLSAKKIVKAQYELKNYEVMNPNQVTLFAPVVEKPSNEPAFLLEQPIEILKKGTFNNVPLIMGYTTGEGILYQLAIKIFNDQREVDLEKEIPYDLKCEKGSKKSKELALKIQKFYFGEEHISRKGYKMVTLKSDNNFLHGIHRQISYMKLSNKAPIFLYRMSVETSINLVKSLCTTKCVVCSFVCLFFSYKCYSSGHLIRRFFPKEKIEGVCHGDDVSYLFNSFASPRLKKGSIEEISMQRFVKMWTNFAKTGHPTPVKTDLVNILWEPITHDSDFYLDIGRELKMGKNPDCDRMQFWDSFYSN